MNGRPDLDDIRRVHRRILPHIHRTPVLNCATLDRLSGAALWFKCENLQKAGAFKSRGAVNAVFSLSAGEARHGVVTHSSGNHAAALARAASLRGIPAYIVMPANAPAVKIDAVRGYGGVITLCEPNLAAREAGAAELAGRTGATLIHPYDDWRIIAGQATCALEFLAQAPDLDAILVPVGGGGLLSGTLLAAKSLRPDIRVFGCEPANADDALRSIRAHRLLPAMAPNTVADGLLTSLSERTFGVISELVDGILPAPEDAIIPAMLTVWERMKTVVEPSAAVPLASLWAGGHGLDGMRVGVILSGGNVDFRRVRDWLP